MKKRLFGLFIVFSLCIGLMSVTALAEEDIPNNLYVGSTNISSNGYCTSADSGSTIGGNAYGNVTLDDNLTVGNGEILTVNDRSVLNNNGKLINNGIIEISGTDKLNNRGSIINNSVIPADEITGNIPPIITNEDTNLMSGTVNLQYSDTKQLKTLAEVSAWSWNGSVPPGLSLNDAGKITGTPSKEGTYRFTVTAVNDYGSDSKEFTMTINPENLIVTPVIAGTDLITQPGYTMQFGDGTVSFDAASNTLTLDSVTIDCSIDENNGIYYRNPDAEYDGLIINLVGDSSIVMDNDMQAIQVRCNEVTITGDGSLTLNGYSENISTSGVLNIVNTDINCTATGWGSFNIKTQGALNITGSDVVLNAPEDGYGINGIMGNKVQVKVKKSKLDINNGYIGILTYGSVSFTDSDVNIEKVGDSIINTTEMVNISGGSLKAESKLAGIWAGKGIIINNHANVKIVSDREITAFSYTGMITIDDSIVSARGPEGTDAFIGNGGTEISGSWVEIFDGNLNNKAVVTDSVVFTNNNGVVIGSLILPGNVTVGEKMKLTVNEGTSIVVPSGVVFTNSGEVVMLGSIEKNGGEIVCNRHNGGTATCVEKARCVICGEQYGALLEHELTKMGAKTPTCTEEGYTGDKVCTVCGNVVEEGGIISKLAHSFQNGKCTVCGAVDSNYNNQEVSAVGDKASSQSEVEASPQTGDSSNMQLWITVLLVSGAGVISLAVYGRKRNYR